MKRIIIISSVVIVLIIAVYLIFFKKSNNTYTFRFDKITRGDVTAYVTATGTLNAVTSVDVGTQVSGIISKLYADFNSVVKAGQLIAQIDPTTLNQAVRDAQATVDKAQAQSNQSTRTYEREKVLYDKKLDSQSNYETVLAAYESDKASLASAQANLDRAKTNLAYATITAPISGVVINRQVSVGQTVAASFSSPTLFTIANDLSKMQVEATVDESDIGKVSDGQTATFTVDAYPDNSFKGTVSQIRLAPQVIQNVVNYTVVISVNNDSLKLMPGMTANVKILVGQKHGVLVVSNMALRFQPPADLVDSVKLKELREMMKTNPHSRTGTSQTGGKDQSMQGGQGMIQQIERNKFQVMRDSIIKVHGGKMSKDQMAAEFNKAYSKIKKMDEQKKAPNINNRVSSSSNKYSIVNIYPSYEKNSDDLTAKYSFGRIWLLNLKGKLEPLFVRTGLNDGKSTEIISDKVAEGEEVVISADANGNQSGSAATNPLAGQQGPGQFRGR